MIDRGPEILGSSNFYTGLWGPPQRPHCFLPVNQWWSVVNQCTYGTVNIECPTFLPITPARDLPAAMRNEGFREDVFVEHQLGIAAYFLFRFGPTQRNRQALAGEVASQRRWPGVKALPSPVTRLMGHLQARFCSPRPHDAAVSGYAFSMSNDNEPRSVTAEDVEIAERRAAEARERAAHAGLSAARSFERSAHFHEEVAQVQEVMLEHPIPAPEVNEASSARHRRAAAEDRDMAKRKRDESLADLESAPTPEGDADT